MEKMFQKTLKALIGSWAVVLLLQAATVDASCNECSDYGVACVTATSFNLCQGNVPQIGRTFTCPSNKQCSDTKAKCVEPTADTAPTCDSNARSCGVCDGTKLFVCTSRTTFLQCDGVTPTTVTGNCSEGFVCDSSGGELCKNECTRPAELECDRDKPL